MTSRYVSSLPRRETDARIFELQSALEDSEGKGTNFYSVLGLSRGASLAQIRKAYREKSLEWQYVHAPQASAALTLQSGQEPRPAECAQAVRAPGADPQYPA